MRLYIDNSALNRPFDDKSQPRVWLEAVAMLLVLEYVEFENATLLRSPVHDEENDRSPDATKRKRVRDCLSLASEELEFLDNHILARGRALEAQGLKAFDSLHIACAERMEADSFLTCDDWLIRRYSGTMVVENPVRFIERLSLLR